MEGGGDLLMPKLGLTMTEGTVAEWRVDAGADFAAGDILVVVETDKIANEIEAPAPGRLLAILTPAGTTVAVGAPIARWTINGRAALAAPPSHPDAAPLPPPAALPIPTLPPAAGSRLLATPLARRMARQSGIDLNRVRGSGPRGRIKAADLDRASANLPTVTEPTRIAPSTRQASAARALTAAKRDVPHFYLTTEAEVSELLGLRDQLNARRPEVKITLTHFLLIAVARALVERPEANRVWRDDVLCAFPTVDIGIAVQTERGLLAPVLRDVGAMSLGGLARAAAALIGRARDASQLTLDDLKGGAITVSNAGMHGITYMSSIITPGQSAILGVGGLREVFRPGPDGRPLLRREIGLVLSCDHRVHDGVSGADLLNRIRYTLESPLSLFL